MRTVNDLPRSNACPFHMVKKAVLLMKAKHLRHCNKVVTQHWFNVSETGVARRHEPWLALSGGPGEGLRAMHEVVACASILLWPGGFVAIEV